MREVARTALVCVALAAASPAAALAQDAAAPAPVTTEVETSLTGRLFLKAVEGAQEPALLRMPGLTRDVVGRILEHRKAGKPFANLIEFRKITKISAADLSIALEPYQAEELALQGEAQRKPVSPPPAPAGKAGGRQMSRVDPNAPGTPATAPAPPAGPVGAVRPGFYGKLPGYEQLDTIDPLKKKEFLEAVNREMCACGCANETLAYCLVNDPGCPVVKARVRKVYEDIVGKPAN